MLDDIITDPLVREEIDSSGFTATIEELQTYLGSRGYAAATVRYYTQSVVHFALWAVRKKLAPSDITTKLLASFLSHHLSRCHCPLTGVRQRNTVRAALRHFEIVLDAGGRRPRQQELPSTAVDREVEQFDAHLSTTCGLRDATRTYRKRYARDFLQEFFGAGRVDVARLSPRKVIRYVARRASCFKPRSLQVVASSLRSYFRYLQIRGESAEALLLAVPCAAHWKLAHLPNVLSDDQVGLLLGAFDRTTKIGRRDYALARCLTDLGLRAGEVAGLRLEDINWRQATLRISGGKSRRDDELPLPALVGRAISVYLRRARPETTARNVFVRSRPPVGQGLTPRVVRNVILRAASRVGLQTVVTGTRILRHTAATRMLRHGASLKEVADVLRHRCLDTTAIYAKVDTRRLADVAVPWPEEELR